MCVCLLFPIFPIVKIEGNALRGATREGRGRGHLCGSSKTQIHRTPVNRMKVTAKFLLNLCYNVTMCTII